MNFLSFKGSFKVQAENPLTNGIKSPGLVKLAPKHPAEQGEKYVTPSAPHTGM